MASVIVKMSPFNQLLRRLPTNRLDPVARTAALIEIIARGFTKNLPPNSNEFRILIRAVRFLLHDARVVNRVFVDHDMHRARDTSSDAVPEWSPRERKIKIDEARQRLERKSADYEDIEHGMDVVVRVFRSMHTEFLYALQPESISLVQKYMCAALIPPTVRLLKRKWLPVQATANRK
jgi:hypothetical protein